MPVTTSPLNPFELRLYTDRGADIVSWHSDGSFHPMLPVTFQPEFVQFALPNSPCRVIVKTATQMVISCSIYPKAIGKCSGRLFQTDQIRYYSITDPKGFDSLVDLDEFIRSNAFDQKVCSTACGLSFATVPNLRRHIEHFHTWPCGKKLSLQRLLIVIDCPSQTDVPFMPRAKHVYHRS